MSCGFSLSFPPFLGELHTAISTLTATYQNMIQIGVTAKPAAASTGTAGSAESIELTRDRLAYLAAMAEVDKIMPSGKDLRRLAELNPPPQWWFDEGPDHPF